jgi:hypothetical protein
LDGFTDINVAVERVKWWCHYSKNNKNQFGCPHGMGGSKSDFFDGWFSEMGFFDTFQIPSEKFQNLNYINELGNKIGSINNRIKMYLYDFSKTKEYSECLMRVKV